MNHSFNFKKKENYDNQKPNKRRDFGPVKISGAKHYKRVCFISYKQVKQNPYIEGKFAHGKLINFH